MAGDKMLFQEAMKRGATHAWNGRWDRAAEEYRVALGEFPEDASAKTYLAMALYRSGQFEEALALYEALWKAQPSNLVLLQRVAELQEVMGDTEAACVSYRVLGEVHSRRHAIKDALEAWRKVVELKPDDPVLWGLAMDVAVKAGAVARLMPGYLELARQLALQRRFQEAIQIAEKAQLLSPGNPAVVSMLSAITRALQYSWRAAAAGEPVLVEVLAGLLPPLQVVAPPPPVVEPGPPAPVAEDAKPTFSFEEPSPRERVVEPSVPPAELQPEEPAAEEVRPTVAEAPAVADEGSGEVEPSPPEEEAGTVALEVVEAESAAPEVLEGGPLPEEPPGEAGPPTVVEDAVADVEPPEAVGVLEPSQPETEVLEPTAAAVELEALDVPVVGELPEPEAAAIGEPSEEAPAELAELSPAEPVRAEEAEPAEVAEAPSSEAVDVAPLEAALAEALVVEPVGPEEAAHVQPEPEDGLAVPEVMPPEAVEAAEPQGGDVPEEAPVVARTAEELVELAREARSSGRLKDAVELLTESLLAGTPIAERYVELGEVQEQLGQREQAAAAYEGALGLAPNHPGALLGMARLDLSAHRLDQAQDTVRRVLEASASEGERPNPAAVVQMLEILRERVVFDDLEGAAEGLIWLRSAIAAEGLPSELRERLALAPVELLGRYAGEHLEEIALLPPEERGEVAWALRRAEDMLVEGRVRSATDEMYRLLGYHPGFLPAHSVLGNILAVQGRVEEARDRSRRVLELYQMRGMDRHALGVLWWAVTQDVSDGEARDRLVALLRERGRTREAELVERGQWDPHPWIPRILVQEPPPSAGEGESASQAHSLEVEAGPAEASGASAPVADARVGTAEDAVGLGMSVGVVPARFPSDDEPASWESLLRLAEHRFASGDRAGALELVRTALESGDGLDEDVRAGLVRILQLMDSGHGWRDGLVGILRRRGLPGEMAD